MSVSFDFLKYVRPNLKLFNNFERLRRISLGRPINCNEKKSQSSDKDQKKDDKAYPEEPTSCCMSGCANCVWLEYAEKLTEYYKDGGEQALKEIEEKISDPQIKAFLHHELRMRNIKPK